MPGPSRVSGAQPADNRAVPENIEPRVVTHRYPWRAEEIVIITVLLVLPSVLMSIFGQWGLRAALTVAAPAALGLWLVWLGHSRKTRSIVRATLTGTHIVISRPNQPKSPDSTGDLSNVAYVSGHQLDRLDPSLVLEAHPTEAGLVRSTYIPMRLARLIAADLAPVLKGAHIKATATDLVEQIKEPPR